MSFILTLSCLDLELSGITVCLHPKSLLKCWCATCAYMQKSMCNFCLETDLEYHFVHFRDPELANLQNKMFVSPTKKKL